MKDFTQKNIILKSALLLKEKLLKVLYKKNHEDFFSDPVLFDVVRF